MESEGDKGKIINVKRNGEGVMFSPSPSIVKLFLEADKCRLNRTVTENVSSSHV